MNILDQVDMPSQTAPASGSLWDQIVGPLMPLLEGAWFLTTHILLPIALIGGLVGMVFAGITGNRQGMQRARGAIFAVPTALFFVAAAVLISNWVLTSY